MSKVRSSPFCLASLPLRSDVAKSDDAYFSVVFSCHQRSKRNKVASDYKDI